MSWQIVITKQAEKDLQKIISSPLKSKLFSLLEIIEKDSLTSPYEKLIGDLSGAYSKRINVQHRLVYQIDSTEHIVKIIRMWTHYGD